MVCEKDVYLSNVVQQIALWYLNNAYIDIWSHLYTKWSLTRNSFQSDSQSAKANWLSQYKLSEYASNWHKFLSPKTPLVGFHLEEHYFKNTCKSIVSCVLEFLVGFTTGWYHFLKTLKLGIISGFIFTMASHHKSFHLDMVTTLEFSKAMTIWSQNGHVLVAGHLIF